MQFYRKRHFELIVDWKRWGLGFAFGHDTLFGWQVGLYVGPFELTIAQRP